MIPQNDILTPVVPFQAYEVPQRIGADDNPLLTDSISQPPVDSPCSVRDFTIRKIHNPRDFPLFDGCWERPLSGDTPIMFQYVVS